MSSRPLPRVWSWAISLLVAMPLYAQQVAVPIDTQLPLLLKVVSQDRRLERSESDYVLGVLYQARFRPSLEFYNAVRQLAGRGPLPKVGGRRIRLLPIEINVEDMPSALADNPCDALYVGPLQALSITDVAAAAVSGGSLTLAAAAPYVRQGLAVGVDQRGEQLRILINLQAAEAVGTSFSSRFLALSAVEVVEP